MMDETPQPAPGAADPSASQSAPPPATAKPGMKRRWMLAILVLTFLFVLMPFLFWQATWFGKPLGVEEIRTALADRQHPREIQHALSQIADRILAADEPTRASARQFYPQVMQIAETGTAELRLTAAWVMGQDDTVPEFHERLWQLLHDASPMVRRNAALGLVRFDDASGLEEIRALLAPYSMPSPFAGALATRLRSGDAINPGTLLGHILPGKGSAGEAPGGGTEHELRADVPGQINRWLVADGSAVELEQPILLIDPSPAEVFEALRALYLVGQAQDLPAVEQFVRGGETVPANVRQQAQETAAAIRSRQ
jgi:nucleotide-binding universal stress UspA family protein